MFVNNFMTSGNKQNTTFIKIQNLMKIVRKQGSKQIVG